MITNYKPLLIYAALSKNSTVVYWFDQVYKLYAISYIHTCASIIKSTFFYKIRFEAGPTVLVLLQGYILYSQNSDPCKAEQWEEKHMDYPELFKQIFYLVFLVDMLQHLNTL